MSFPSVEPIDEELRAKVQAAFGEALLEAKNEDLTDFDDTTSSIVEQPTTTKRRGRVPFKRNPDGTYFIDEQGNRVLDHDRSSSTSSTSKPRISSMVPAAPLTKREERQVADRLSSILTGATGVASIAKPYLQMTDEEAAAIASPLSSYLIRMEPTSKVARQILDEYDLVAVAFAALAYVVRVYFDYQKDRKEHPPTTRKVIKESGLQPLPTTEFKSEPTLQPASSSSNEANTDDPGKAWYSGKVSTPIVEGNGVLPRL